MTNFRTHESQFHRFQRCFDLTVCISKVIYPEKHLNGIFECFLHDQAYA